MFHQYTRYDKKLKKAAKSSNQQIVTEIIFPKSFDEVAQDNYVEHTKAYALLFQNKSKYKTIKVALAEMLYREFNSDR